jgi:hypothetical protein
MDPRARELALRAAAKVAFAGSMFGCGNGQSTPPVTGGSPPPTGSPTASSTAVATSTATSTPTSAPTSNVCAPKDLTTPTPGEVACCTDVVHAAVKGGGGIQSPNEVDCCKALAAWNDGQIKAGHGDQESMPERDACCKAMKWGGGITCTPWGPPVPPAMALPARSVRARGMGDDVLDLRRQARAHAPFVRSLPHLRDAAIATWRGRMVNEHGSATVFEHLAEQLAEAGLDDATVRVCRAFAGEERRHGVLCGAVVEALGGEARGPRPRSEAFPRHEDVSPFEAAVRNVISVCCLSETVAVALIGAERFEMPEGPLRDLLSSIWSDEIGHARFGWELLAELAPRFRCDAAMRVRLEAYLRVAFAHLEAHELVHLPIGAGDPPPEGAVLGLCSGAHARALFFDTVRDVIVPRLAALGLAHSSTNCFNRSSASSHRLET